MKIAPFVLVSTASSLETSSTAGNLLAAVGHRNVTHMEALIQGLAEESIQEPGWKFDKDISEALKSIRDMFVVSIQSSLIEAHEADQNHFNCFTKECFGACYDDYEGNNPEVDGIDSCKSTGKKCDVLGLEHRSCRGDVFSAWTTMANACGELCCFTPPKVICEPEDCLCNDVDHCTKVHKDVDKYGQCIVDPYTGRCEVTCGKAFEGTCGGDAKFGIWLNSMIKAFEDSYGEWKEKHAACESAYHAFLEADYECDVTQRKFEQCQCSRNSCELDTCTRNDQCVHCCWVQYEDEVWSKECLEKDRKIDWSATKRIECYVDVLLHDYTKEELLAHCGTEDCINVARDDDYKKCAKICPKVDHNGEWPTVISNKIGAIEVDGHAFREKHDQYHLGDGHYKCDINGKHVMTRHRGLVDRQGEERCTEHLDIDYQFPACLDCEDRSPPVCDAPFHAKWYCEFDRTCKVPDVNHCTDKTCFGAVEIMSSCDGYNLEMIKFDEHSFAWAYNRCECTECGVGYGAYPDVPDYRSCANMCGAHTLVTPTGEHASIYGANFDKKVTTQDFNGAKWQGSEAHQAVTDARGAKDLR